MLRPIRSLSRDSTRSWDEDPLIRFKNDAPACSDTFAFCRCRCGLFLNAIVCARKRSFCSAVGGWRKTSRSGRCVAPRASGLGRDSVTGDATSTVGGGPDLLSRLSRAKARFESGEVGVGPVASDLARLSGPCVSASPGSRASCRRRVSSPAPPRGPGVACGSALRDSSFFSRRCAMVRP